MEIRIDGAMRRFGQDVDIRRGDDKHKERGIVGQSDKEIKFFPQADVEVGDWVRTESGDELHILDIQRGPMVQGKPYALSAKYETKAEHERRSSYQQGSQSPIFNIFGPTYGSNIGTQQHAQVLQPTFTFGDLEQEIDRRGGEDTEALKEMIGEIRATLESQDSLSRSRLLGWSELLNRHAWITGPIAQLLLIYATIGQFG